LSSSKFEQPKSGTRIGFKDNVLIVPDDPIIPYIEAAAAKSQVVFEKRARRVRTKAWSAVRESISKGE
jgi:hypothetical protein